MALICQNCGTQNNDPDPSVPAHFYRCGYCGSNNLVRRITDAEKERRNQMVVGAALGAGVGGAAFGPPGALIGGLIGLAISGKK